MNRTRIFSLLLTTICIASQAQAPLAEGFDHPQDTARTKVWWFFGETETTREGITADLEAFKEAGVGGVVYYDQVHGKGEGADKVFDDHWWRSLIFASQEARRLGLSFEANIGNGYVAGGKWITPDRSMQRLEMTEMLLHDGAPVRLPLPQRLTGGWHHDVAVLAVPYREDLLGDSRLLNIEPTPQTDSVLVFDFGRPFTARSISYEAAAQGKARTSSMQVPPTHQPLAQPDPTRFYGCGFRELPAIGVLEASDDGVTYNFLNNHSDEAVDEHFTFRVGASSVELWNPVKGEKQRLATESNDGQTTTVHLTMAPRESFFVVLSNRLSALPLKEKPVEESLVAEFALPNWAQSSDPRIRYFSGTATYTTTFALQKKSKKATYRLSFDQVGSVAQVFVNGREAGIVWCSPWQLDLTPYINKGVNRLEIRVANSLWNRLVGDANKPEGERQLQQTTPLAQPTDELVPSGLIGKVSIVELKP